MFGEFLASYSTQACLSISIVKYITSLNLCTWLFCIFYIYMFVLQVFDESYEILFCLQINGLGD